MNKKGFTLVELIATLVILGIVVGITIASVNGIFSSTKEKTEDVFISTIKDAMDVYLASNAKELNFNNTCSNTLDKSYKNNVKVYWVSTQFKAVIDSDNKPITQDDLVNPANEEVSCNNASNIRINIYRDEDYVYYYSVDKSRFGCLKSDGVISNLPEGFEC